VSRSFYTEASAEETINHVDGVVYITRYQKEKSACIVRLLQYMDLEGKALLEIGCGAGVWTDTLMTRGAIVTATDIRPHLVEAARTRIATRTDGHTAHFLCGEMESLNLPPHTFDAIFLKDVIEHVEKDRELLERIHSLLKPGGQLLLSTQNAWSLNYLLEGFWERICKRNRNWMGWDDTHVRFYSPRTLTRLFEETGFRTQHRNGAYFIPYRWFTGRLRASHLEPGWAHRFDRISDDRWFSGLGWSIHYLLEAQR
jgi:2-polyprenyl-6-hydroxyphenyl methylase/3-demethylubiquinone-9 3-methyltransferase